MRINIALVAIFSPLFVVRECRSDAKRPLETIRKGVFVTGEGTFMRFDMLRQKRRDDVREIRERVLLFAAKLSRLVVCA